MSTSEAASRWRIDAICSVTLLPIKATKKRPMLPGPAETGEVGRISSDEIFKTLTAG
jgi:hypothetical protein